MVAPLFQDISPPRVLRHIEGANASMFPNFEEFIKLEDHGLPIRPHMDEVCSPVKHLSFVQLLKERGLVSSTRDHGESVSCFFVKESNMLRLAIDARRASRNFADASRVALATPEALARLEAAGGVTAYMAKVGADSVFLEYRLRICHALGRFSAYRSFVPLMRGYT
jgi:hypothetical protein